MSRLAVVLLGVLVGVVCAAGLGMQATYGAQVTADEPQYLLTAQSLAADLDLDISDELAAEVWREYHAADLPEQTRPRPDGSRLSPHDPLLPLLLSGPVAVAAATGVPAWVAAKLTLAVLAGLLASVTAWVAVRRLNVPLWPAVLVVAAFATSPPFAVYGTQVYPEIVAALAVVLALGCLLGPPTRLAALATALAVVALPWLAVKYALVAVVLAVAAAWWCRRDRVVLTVWLVGVAAAGAHWLWFHLTVYGGLTAYAAGDYFAEGGSVSATGPDADYPARTQRIVGLLLDRDFGLLPWAPVFLLTPLVLGWAVHRARQRPRAEMTSRPEWLLLTVLAAGWVVATWVAQTMHGYWWPGRQLVVVLPAVVLLVCAWAGQAWRVGSQTRTWVVAALGLPGLVAYGYQVTETTGAARHTLIVDFATTDWVGFRAARAVLPDFTAPGPATAALAVAWTLLLLGMAWWGRCHAERMHEATDA